MIEIKKWVKPDLEVVLPNDNTYATTKHLKYSLLFEQQIMVVQDCNEDGEVRSHRQSTYFGLRKDGDDIEVCIPKFGWISVYEEIQEKYNNEIADKTILGE